MLLPSCGLSFGSNETNLTVLHPSEICPSKYFTAVFFWLLLMGDKAPTNIPSTEADKHGN